MPRKGQTNSDETRARMSAGRKGKPVSEEQKQKQRALWADPEYRAHRAATRAPVSEETRARMSAAKRGVKKSPEHCKAISDAQRRVGTKREDDHG